MKISHSPDPPRGLIGWRRPSQWLKSPTTLTCPAFGAHTAKQTPFNTRMLDRARAELLIEPEVGALTEEMQIKVCKDGRIAVGILKFAGLLPVAVRSGHGDR